MGEDALFRQRYSHKDEWKGIGMRLHHQPRPHSANHDAGSALRIRGLGMSLAYPVVDRWAGRWLGSDFDATLFDDRRHFRQLRISAACLAVVFVLAVWRYNPARTLLRKVPDKGPAAGNN